MTTETNDTIERYEINGTGPYAFSFRIFDEDDLTVTALETGDVDPVTLTVNSHFTVSGVNDEDGGTITLINSAETTYDGFTLDIRSNVIVDQPTSIKNQGTFAPVVHEKAFDRLSRQIQDLARKVKQSFRYPDNVDLDAKMASRSSWLSRYLFVNASGEIEPAANIGSVALTQSLIGETLYPRTAAEIAALVTPVNYYYPEGNVRRYGAIGDGVTDDTTAIQTAVLVSVGLAELGGTPSGPVFEAYLPKGTYKVTTIYLPDLCTLRGSGRATKLTTTSNAPVLVIGQSIAEANILRVRIHDLQILGNLTGSNQIGIRCGLSGGYMFGNVLHGIHIRDMGGHGIYLASSSTSSMILYNDWDDVQVANTNGYCVYIRSAVYNHANHRCCTFEEGLLGGYHIDYVGGGTTNFSETIKFDTCAFEGNGQLIGGGATYTVGSFGFKSLMIGGHYEFTNCYIENNAMQAADTTGCAVYCQTPIMLSIRNSYLVGGNNLVYLYKGGNAEIEGCHIDPKTNNTALFTFDTPPVSGESYFRVGLNNWYQQYITPSQFSRSINGAATRMLGYRTGRNNYLVDQPRSKNLVLRDASDVASGTGAIGYNAVRRLTNNADGTVNIGVDAVSSVCIQNTYTLALISDSYSSRSALFLMCPTGIALVSQVGTLFTVTKDTASSINVYYDSGTGNYVLQNKTAGTLSYVAVRFIGCEAMLSTDNYSTYEAAYLQT